MRKKFNAVDIFCQLRQSQINKLHLFLAPKADGSHQSLQEQAGSFSSRVQWSNENCVEDL